MGSVFARGKKGGNNVISPQKVEEPKDAAQADLAILAAAVTSADVLPPTDIPVEEVEVSLSESSDESLMPADLEASVPAEAAEASSGALSLEAGLVSDPVSHKLAPEHQASQSPQTTRQIVIKEIQNTASLAGPIKYFYVKDAVNSFLKEVTKDTSSAIVKYNLTRFEAELNASHFSEKELEFLNSNDAKAGCAHFENLTNANQLITALTHLIQSDCDPKTINMRNVDKKDLIPLMILNSIMTNDASLKGKLKITFDGQELNDYCSNKLNLQIDAIKTKYNLEYGKYSEIFKESISQLSEAVDNAENSKASTSQHQAPRPLHSPPVTSAAVTQNKLAAPTAAMNGAAAPPTKEAERDAVEVISGGTLSAGPGRG